MQKPLILAKASLTTEQIERKLELGADGIELQLLGESLSTKGNLRVWKPFSEVYSCDFTKYPIDAIHAPLLSGIGDMTIENMLDREDFPVLENMFALAHSIGKERDKQVTLVVHSETYFANMLDVGNIYNQMRTKISMLLDKYSYTRLAIENVSPVRGIQNKVLHLANNFGYDNIELVGRLRKDLNTDRVGTILDTCHAMLTEKYIKAIYGAAGGEYDSQDYSMKMFVEQNKSLIYHVHFCDMTGSGYGKGRHGIPFTQETKESAFEILRLMYKDYAYTCPLCLEVEELDGFEVCSGFQSTKKVVEEFFEQTEA